MIHTEKSKHNVQKCDMWRARSKNHPTSIYTYILLNDLYGRVADDSKLFFRGG